jgi:hypothetical protein
MKNRIMYEYRSGQYGGKQGNIQEKMEEGRLGVIAGLTSIWAVFTFL